MKGFRYLLASLLGALLVLVVGSAWLEGARAEVTAGPANVIANSSFELGEFAAENAPDGWQHESFLPSAQFSWRDDAAQHGQKSVQISAVSPNDARWIQTVTVKPNATYLFSGWIKTENVVSSAQSDQAGANLCINGTFQRTEGITGTNDWTFVSMLVETGASTQLTVCARLGYWNDATSGTAWFDNLKFVELDPEGPKPTWRVLVLIYKITDFTYTDGGAVEHRVIASMTNAQMQQAAQAAQAFINTDVPALSSGNLAPEITVRYPAQTITGLSPYGAGAWWLAPEDIAQDLDPAFDSVIVIWNPEGTDINTADPEDLSGGQYDSLAPDRGTGQTYTLITSRAATNSAQRNEFKKGYGESLLSFFDAADTAPKPKVDNDPGPTDYLNCAGGGNYVWEEETLADPIPNSIFNNDSGFTHDYYSGETATADQPQRCLGITPATWVTGGPVAGPVFFTYELQAVPAAQMGEPGTAVSYTLNLENRGNMTDTYQLSFSGNSWPVDGPAAVGPLGVDQALAIPLVVTIPPGVDGLDADALAVELLSAGDGRLAESVLLTTTATPIYNFAAAADPAALSGAAGTGVTYTLKITNTGNISDTYDVSFSGNQWPVDLPATAGPLARDASIEFDVLVSIPPDAGGLDTDSLFVTLTSQGDGSVQESVSLTTTAEAEYKFTAVADPAQKSGDVGTGVVYTIKIDNLGNISDTYDVVYSGYTWLVSGLSEVGPLTGPGSGTLEVTVTIPANAGGLETDSVAVILTSQGDGSRQTSVLLTTEAKAFYDVELSPPQSSALGITGTTVSYFLTLKNTGNMSDSFSLSSTASAWLVEIPAEIGPLAPQESASIKVEVTVPGDADDGEEDMAIITATSQTAAGVADSAAITTTAEWPVLYMPVIAR